MEGASDQYLLPASFTQYVLLLSKLWNRQTFILNSVMHVLLLRLCYATVMKGANVHLYRHCSRRQHFSPVICMLCSQNSYGACKYYFLNNLNMCALLKNILESYRGCNQYLQTISFSLQENIYLAQHTNFPGLDQVKMEDAV